MILDSAHPTKLTCRFALTDLRLLCSLTSSRMPPVLPSPPFAYRIARADLADKRDGTDGTGGTDTTGQPFLGAAGQVFIMSASSCVGRPVAAINSCASIWTRALERHAICLVTCRACSPRGTLWELTSCLSGLAVLPSR
jgi:hypothetical protein